MTIVRIQLNVYIRNELKESNFTVPNKLRINVFRIKK